MEEVLMKRKNLMKNVWGIGLTVLLLLGCSPQATSIPADTSIPPTDTPLPPTHTSEPLTPTTVSYAGKTFTGPLDSGTIAFTISADGVVVEPGLILSLKDVSCAEGGGDFSVLSMKITLPDSLPIENLTFKYGSDNMFRPGYGMELIGQFDTATSASGTFKYLDDSKPLEPCTYGPFQWTASAP
jgi:hypothetical protein